MTTPIDQQLQPPPMATTQQPHAAPSGQGSVGPVIAVLAVISILGVIAGMIGRLCSGRPVMGYGQYDVEGWVERKCASCLDGSLDPPPPPLRRRAPPVEAVPVAEPVGGPPEMKEAIRENSHPTAVGGGGES